MPNIISPATEAANRLTPEPLSPERLAEAKNLLRYESSISFHSARAKETMLLLVAEVEQWRATYGRDSLPNALSRLEKAAAERERLLLRVDEVERQYIFDTAELKKRVAELEAAAPHRFEAEFQTESDAKRRLANCKHCRGARTDARHTEGGTA